MPDSQPRQQPIKRLLAAALDVVDHLARDFFTDGARHELLPLLDFRAQRRYVIDLHAIKIGKLLHEAALDELIDQDITQALDIHLPAMAEPADTFLPLRRTSRIHAVQVDSLLKPF